MSAAKKAGSDKTTISIIVEVNRGVAKIKKLMVNGHKAKPMPMVPGIKLMDIEISAQRGSGGVCPIVNGKRMC